MTALHEAARLWSPRPSTSSSEKSTRRLWSVEGSIVSISCPTPPPAVPPPVRTKSGWIVTVVGLGVVVVVDAGTMVVVGGTVVDVATDLPPPPPPPLHAVATAMAAAAVRAARFIEDSSPCVGRPAGAAAAGLGSSPAICDCSLENRLQAPWVGMPIDGPSESPSLHFVHVSCVTSPPAAPPGLTSTPRSTP